MRILLAEIGGFLLDSSPILLAGAYPAFFSPVPVDQRVLKESFE